MLQFSIMGPRLDVVRIAKYPESALKNGLLAIFVYRDPRPASLYPVLAPRLLDKSAALEHTMRKPWYPVRFSDLTSGADVCHGKVVVEDVVVRLEDKADGGLALFESKGDIEFGKGVDAVGGRLDDGIVEEGDMADGVPLYRVR